MSKAPTTKELAELFRSMKAEQEKVQEYLNNESSARGEITHALVQRIIDVERKNKELEAIVTTYEGHRNSDTVRMNNIETNLENYRKAMVQNVKDVDKYQTKFNEFVVWVKNELFKRNAKRQ